MRTLVTILESLSESPLADGRDEAVALLFTPNAAVQGVFPESTPTVGEIEPAWRGRLEHAIKCGVKPAAGLSDFVRSLHDLANGTALQWEGVRAGEKDGLFYFIEGTATLVGFVIVGPRKSPPPRIIDQGGFWDGSLGD
jgi:hypothetical protein